MGGQEAVGDGAIGCSVKAFLLGNAKKWQSSIIRAKQKRKRPKYSFVQKIEGLLGRGPIRKQRSSINS